MDESKRDKTKVDPASGAEEKEPAQPLRTVPEGQKADATTAVIPGTGHDSPWEQPLATARLVARFERSQSPPRPGACQEAVAR